MVLNTSLSIDNINTTRLVIKLPEIMPFIFPKVSFSKGGKGLSITCIKGVSFINVNFDNSTFLISSVNIA